MKALSFYETTFLGVVQGATEFLPVSSSAHLLIAQRIFGIEPSISLLIFLHLATAFSIVFFLRRRIIEIIKRERTLLLYMGWGTIVTGLVCLPARSFIESLLCKEDVIPPALLITGIILAFTYAKKGSDKKLSFFSVTLIGLAQGIAALPGISRMGMVACAALLQGIKRETVAEYSLLLSFSTILSASIYECFTEEISFLFCPSFVLGFFVAFFAGMVSLKILCNTIKKMNFLPFSIYCFALSSILWCS